MKVFFSRWLPLFFLTIILVGWFSLFQSWGHFVDPDAFTHAKIASLIAQQGPLHAFPWLDLTSLGQRFFDQHFLYHVALVPFVTLFGALPGMQIAIVLFATTTLLVFYSCLRSLKVENPVFWTLMLASTPPLLERLSFGKASSLAIAWFLVGLYALLKERPWAGWLAGLGFSLTHGGWPLLLVCQGIYVFADSLGTWRAEKNVFRAMAVQTGRTSSRVLYATILGCFLGLLLHPNAGNALNFLWIQVVEIGVKAPMQEVALGVEWGSIRFVDLVAFLPLFILAGSVIFYISNEKGWPAWPESFSRTRRRQILCLIPVVIFLACVTMKSKRYAEYFLPAWGLFWAYLDGFLTKENLRTAFIRWDGEGRRVRWATIVGVSVLLMSFFLNEMRAYEQLQSYFSPYEEIAPGMQAISARAQPGDRVFQPQWDLFPQMFLLDDRLKYVSGMDPTYLYEANREISKEYTKFVWDEATSAQVYPFIHDVLGSRFVLFERERNRHLEKNLKADERFLQVFESTSTAAYEIR